MRVIVSTDFSVWKYKDRLYTKFVFSSIIKRYSEELGTLTLCCPVKEVSSYPNNFIDVTDIIASVIATNKLSSLLRIKNSKLEQAIKNSDIVLGRFPGFIPIFVASIANKLNKPLFSEVMGCGWDAYWNHSFLGKLVAPYILFGTKKALRGSKYALYVTNEFLQQRYPCNQASVGVSDVVISNINKDIIERRKNKIKNFDSQNITLMTCAAIDVRYKGQQFVIKSIPTLNKKGIRVNYYCVGQGSESYLRKVAKKCGVQDQVHFTGSVTHDEIFDLLDECDIYLQPSLQEGLPRALVEAMSRGCPSIGAKTGGIPELLPEECIIPKKSVSGISETIVKMVEEGLDKYSDNSFNRAENFQKTKLDKRRNNYFEYIKTNIG
ncbi:glycosyltransferase [Enterococcus faecium]|uniref:glycosyltransferase n=4 Tax=Enterococcus faecium TaxID=1352 RepID=UPI0002A24630|nr:glycosyltransferase [Enterococcus faecium]EGP4720267.1 glycosyltransferase [Enterococcus faecium]EGP5194789.1 glycosyltransferase [Enterococcus faecium]EGP5346734.1 glycosyltransferase [Enterococcus faecium]EHQ2679761.1 glycosyltransferase [Enterococcus faecium]ELA61240.1 hypothetical protein OGE_02966 [Enterococcus faecium EnGen0022]